MKPEYAMQPMAVAMALTNKNLNAAMLFLDLWPYYSRWLAKHPEQEALILSDSDLCKRTGMAFDQTRRAKRFLKKNGFIRTRVKKDQKYHHGHTTTHIRIPDEVVKLAEGLKNGTVQICAVGNEQNHISQTVPECTLPIYIKEKNKSNAPSPSKQEQCSAVQDDLSILKEIFGNE